MPELDSMGNFWSRVSRSKKQMSPPRTVDELLQEVASSASGPEALLDADDAIRAHYWASRFREDFLEKRKMHGKVAALRFLVLTMPFDEEYGSPNNNSHWKGKSPQAREESLSWAMSRAHGLFFAEEAEQHLPLSNTALFESLRRTGERLEAAAAAAPGTPAKLTEEEVQRVREARADISVRKNGLDPKFAKFLSGVDLNSAKLACLLSIL